MLKISNTICASMALGFIITCFSANAVTPTFTLMEQGANVAPMAINTGENARPEFTVSNIRSLYYYAENKAQVDFVISSNEFLNYYAYIRKNNVNYGDVSGFVNNRSVVVEILAKEVSMGDYELVIDVYNNDKRSASKTYHFKLIQ
ncbi:hypothetical protein [Yersinia mollaretii]|uniref:hypothetical protein n=1 Tax=Yersinia mollaretii TaxID=33060 RepID=UPI0011A30742|nr:hypothetical protein [Yersinia mollaretii]